MRRSTRKQRMSGGGGAMSACRKSAKNHKSLEKKQKSLQQQMNEMQEELKPLYAQVNAVSQSLAQPLKKPKRSAMMQMLIDQHAAKQARESAAQAAEKPKRSAFMENFIRRNKARQARESAAASKGGRRRTRR